MSSSSPLPAREQNAYLMPTSPAKARRGSADYRPCIKKAVGNVPACLVNASVTYCGNDQIYAFGGFDQFTDEGWTPSGGKERDQLMLIIYCQSTTTSYG
jgi:hypothetical protein